MLSELNACADNAILHLCGYWVK